MNSAAEDIVYVEQKERNGTATALLCARERIQGHSFLLLYGDDLYSADDIKLCIGKEPAILVRAVPNPERFGACLQRDGYLVDILEKHPDPGTNLVNIGVYFLDQTIFDMPLPQPLHGEYYVATQIGAWAKEHRVRLIEATFWHPIATPEDVDKAHALVRRR